MFKRWASITSCYSSYDRRYFTNASLLDKAGYYALEVWGGATFDACLRFLNEDPWERLRAIRKACPNTKLQMLFRGQNILGYRHYSDELVEKFVQKSLENGIDIIRVFDALNDLRNLKSAVDATNKYKNSMAVTAKSPYLIQQVLYILLIIMYHWLKMLKKWGLILFVSKTWQEYYFQPMPMN